MARRSSQGRAPASGSPAAAVQQLKQAIDEGVDWARSLVAAMAACTAPQETYRGRRYTYLVGGEAFDWLLLAQRLCEAVDGLVPQREREEMLSSGRFPSLDSSEFKRLLGSEKHRGYLNYYYGVTVEEALQLATEEEVHKRHTSNGVLYRDDYSEEAFAKVYGLTKRKLLETFREEKHLPSRRSVGLGESKEFTYWLFKYRLKSSDSAKMASDTRKGLDQLEKMHEARQRGLPIR